MYSGTGVCAGQAHWQSTTLWKKSGAAISVGFIPTLSAHRADSARPLRSVLNAYEGVFTCSPAIHRFAESSHQYDGKQRGKPFLVDRHSLLVWLARVNSVREPCGSAASPMDSSLRRV